MADAPLLLSIVMRVGRRATSALGSSCNADHFQLNL